MSEIVMTTEAEVEDFTDELSDEALDRGDVPLFVENRLAGVLSF
ncbi:unannotated protein [freshwater metagenome]|uniref:Unannotated protein n=1 Tax=freshwater metagenome TaxID=449393 RepID=A0A6J6A386_9ZZZZ